MKKLKEIYLDKEIAEKEAEFRAKQIEEAKRRTESFMRAHNRSPLTRREFLNSGLLPFAAAITMPSIFDVLFGNQAMAATICSAGSSKQQFAPLITLNLAGGASLAANFMPVKANNSDIGSYNLLGYPNKPSMVTDFGGVKFSSSGGVNNTGSKLYQGIVSRTSAATRQRTAAVMVPVALDDDSDANPMDISGLVALAGRKGTKLALAGNVGLSTTVRARPAFDLVPPRATRVNSANDLQSATSLAGSLNTLSQNQRVKLMQLIDRLSESQKTSLARLSGGEALSALTSCATKMNVELVQDTSGGMDARQNSTVAGVWGINANSNASSMSVVAGSLTMAALNGNIGMTGISMGGYDYHDRTRTTGDERDQAAGETIGNILETARVLNQKMFLVISTDGSCVSDRGNGTWVSDRGLAGMLAFFVYDPAGRPSTTSPIIGGFRDDQAADRSFKSAQSASHAAAAVFANYLKFSGQMNLFNSVLPNVFSAGDLNSIVKLG